VSVEIALLGLAGGLLVGLSGVGAGVLMVPVLVMLGVPPSLAIGTDLAYSAVTKSVGTIRNAAMHLVDRVWLLWMAVGSVPGTIAGTAVTALIPPASVERLLRLALAGVLIVASVAIVAKELLMRQAGRAVRAKEDLVRRRPWMVALAASGIGALVGLTSIGSGSLFLLMLLAWSGLSPRQAIATDIANAAGLTLVAAGLHLLNGSVDLALAGKLLVGSVPGILLGARLAQHVPARPLKVGLAALVLASGLRMML
jgi:uncharacterized membrane protein YfcA